MQGWKKIGAALVCFVLLPVLSYAQAAITGVVKDTSNAVLPGVTVEAASPALIEKVRSAITDGTGQYRIENLRPGVYTVTFTLPGFATVKREGVELGGTFTATVNGEMRVGALEETVTVTGETPVVDVQSATKERVVDHDVIDAIPTGRSDRSFALLVPGVSIAGAGTTQDVGGTSDVLNTSMTVHGSRGTDQRITYNGISIGVTVGGGQLSNAPANMSAFQEVTVDTGSTSAELATGGVGVNFIPKDGGNTFKGTAFASFANSSMQGSNYTDALKVAGLATPSGLQHAYDFNPGIGGPLKKDVLWFYLTYKAVGVNNYPANIFNNLNANNVNAWTYVADTSSRPVNTLPSKDAQFRLTWQATPKNKIGVAIEESRSCYCTNTASATTSPEAALYRNFPTERNIYGDWTAPITSRLLFQASMIHRTEAAERYPGPGVPQSMVSVTDQGLGNLVYRAPTVAGNNGRDTQYKTLFYRGSLSYITGAHAIKAGFSVGSASESTQLHPLTQPVEYRFNNGVPNQITELGYPANTEFNTDEDSGAFVQDKWTLNRLTLMGGFRIDWYKNSFPAQSLGPVALIPGRNLAFADSEGVNWKDWTPRTGLAYDVFGDGKTAVKASLNKYLQGQGSSDSFFGTVLGPIFRVPLSTTRSWTDSNGNFIPECDLTNPAKNGECAAMANAAFASPQPAAASTYDPSILSGWGNRPYNWEFTAGVQQQILPRVSVDFTYFRRWFGNFYVTDNLALAASDFTQFNLVAPTTDARLPVAGQAVTGLFDVNPAKFGATNNYVTSASNYGNQVEHWNGIDFVVNARPRSGLLVQGGISTGKTDTNNCEVVAQVPESLQTSTFGVYNSLTNANLGTGVWTPLQYCSQSSGFLTQVKVLASYTVPKIDVQVSGTVQSIPGPQILSAFNASNALVTPALGRALSGGAANISVELTSPGSITGDRLNQLDLRVGKILKFGKTRTGVNLDLFNVTNSNAILSQNNSFGGATAWQTPQSILAARFVKISAQFDF